MLREPSYVEAAPVAQQGARSRLSATALGFWASLLRPYRRRLPGLLVSIVAAAGATLYFGHVVRTLVDQGLAVDDVLIGSLGLSLEGRSWGDARLLPALLQMGLASVVLACASYGRFYTVSWLGERLIADIRLRLYAHLLQLGPRFYETRPLGDVLSGLTADTTLLQVLFGTSVAIALRNFIILGGGLTLMVLTSVRLTLVMLAMVPVLALFFAFYGRHVRRLVRVAQDAQAQVYATSEETLRAVQTVQAYGREASCTMTFAERTEAALTEAVRRIQARGLMTMMVILLVTLFFGAMLWVGEREMTAGHLTAGQLTSFIFYALFVAGTMGSMGELMGDLQRALGATDRILETLHTQPGPTRKAMSLSQSGVSLPERVAGTLELQRVSFSYPSRPQTRALDDISLVIHAGERVAVVGPSGAGKSTLFQILLRFYDPGEGAVRLDGVEIRAADVAQVRRCMGWVPQDPVIFSATIAENIAFGNPQATPKMIAAAAKTAYADEFIAQLPQGYETFVGEKGVRLSGGQRQRLALARALLVSPAVLLLDEATSALDSESEMEVQKGLAAAMVGRTSLIIAHRLSTVIEADRIVVMEQGRIIAVGRHHQLLKGCELYTKLAEKQFIRLQA